MAALAFLGWQGREWPPHLGGPEAAAFDRGYMRRMAAHHAQGIDVARIAERSAADPHLRALSRLMVAEQADDLAIFAHWWRSWFDGPVLPPPAPEEDAQGARPFVDPETFKARDALYRQEMLFPWGRSARRRMQIAGYRAAFALCADTRSVCDALLAELDDAAREGV